MMYDMFMQRRRGVHSLIAVSMLIGFTVAAGGVLLVVLSDYRDDIAGSTDCMLSDVTLYDTGSNRTYFVAVLHNLGSEAIISANITFVDDHGMEYGFYDSMIDVAPSTAWKNMGSFAASVSDKEYVIRATAVTADGSKVECHTG